MTPASDWSGGDLPRSRPGALPREVLTGVAWLVGQGVVLKIASVMGRVALARWLAPSDFGVVAMSDALLATTLVLQRAGLREQVVTSDRRASVASSAFWLSVTTGLVGGALVLLALPAAAAFFGEPRLAPLLVFVGLASPLLVLPTVPQGLLEAELRFATIAKVNVFSGLTATTLAVTLAACGLGPFALVIPGPVVAVLSFVGLRSGLPQWRLGRPDWGVGRQLLRRSLPILGTSLAAWVIAYGDNTVIGRLLGTQSLGLYAFAFALANQLWILAASSLPSVLLAGFRSVGERGAAAQGAAFVDAVRHLAILGVPLCLVQALSARPLMLLVFDARWEGAIAVVEILSLGMLGRLLGAPGQHLVEARQHFETLARAAIPSAGVFLLLVAWGASRGTLPLAATAVAFGYTVDGLLRLTLAARLAACPSQALLRAVLVPLGLGAVAFGPAALVRWTWADRAHGLVDLASALSSAAVYAVLLRWARPRDWRGAVAGPLGRLTARGRAGGSPPPAGPGAPRASGA